MSSIPSSAMPHAKSHDHPDHKPDDVAGTNASRPETPQQPADTSDAAADEANSHPTSAVVEKAKDGLEEARTIGLSRPSKGLAIGAAVIAGLAAAVAVPLVRARKASDAKPKRRPAARKAAAGKPARSKASANA